MNYWQVSDAQVAPFHPPEAQAGLDLLHSLYSFASFASVGDRPPMQSKLFLHCAALNWKAVLQAESDLLDFEGSQDLIDPEASQSA